MSNVTLSIGPVCVFHTTGRDETGGVTQMAERAKRQAEEIMAAASDLNSSGLLFDCDWAMCLSYGRPFLFTGQASVSVEGGSALLSAVGKVQYVSTDESVSHKQRLLAKMVTVEAVLRSAGVTNFLTERHPSVRIGLSDVDDDHPGSEPVARATVIEVARAAGLTDAEVDATTKALA